MVGNPRLAALGFVEESRGHNALAGGFQGQRHWTDFLPNGDFLEAILNSSFDWNGIREPFIVATENDAFNAVPMLFGHLLTNTASVFADVRTYWSPEAVERVTGYTVSGLAQRGIIHLINSGAAALDGTGMQEYDGKPAMKPLLGDHGGRGRPMPGRHLLVLRQPGIFPRRRFFPAISSPGAASPSP